MVPAEKTSLAFRDVTVIPEVGQLYALSIAPTADRFQLLVPECTSLSAQCIDTMASC